MADVALAPRPSPTAAQTQDDLPRGTSVVAASLLAAAAVLPLTIADGSSTTDVRLTALSLSLLGASCLPLVSGRAGVRRALRDFRLGSWFVVWYTVGFGVLSLLREPALTVSNAQIATDSLIRGLQLAGFGLVAWTIGYLVTVRTFSVGRAQRNRPPSMNIIALLFACGLLGHLLAALSGRFGYVGDAAGRVATPAVTGQLVDVLTSAGTFALVLLAINFVIRRTGRARTLLLLALSEEVTVGLLTGMKSEFILTLFAITPVLAIGTNRFPTRILTGGAALLLLLVFPFVTTYRETVRAGSTELGPQQAFERAPALIRDIYTEQGPVEILGTASDSLVQRLGQIPNVAIIVQKTPSDIPYKSLSEVAGAPALGFIPRFIWPGKPILDGGYRFNQEYFGMPPTIYSSAAITPVGDLYRHGGLLVVAFGMAAFGVAARFVDRRLHPRTGLRNALYFIPFFVALINLEIGLVAMLAGLPVLIGMPALIDRWVFGAREAA